MLSLIFQFGIIFAGLVISILKEFTPKSRQNICILVSTILILSLTQFEQCDIYYKNFKIFEVYWENNLYLTRSSTPSEFKSAYKKLSTLYHPDKAKNNQNEDKWNSIKNCNEIFNKEGYKTLKMIQEISRDELFVLNLNNFEKKSQKDSALDLQVHNASSSISAMLLLVVFLFWTESPSDSFIKQLVFSQIIAWIGQQNMISLSFVTQFEAFIQEWNMGTSFDIQAQMQFIELIQCIIVVSQYIKNVLYGLSDVDEFVKEIDQEMNIVQGLQTKSQMIDKDYINIVGKYRNKTDQLNQLFFVGYIVMNNYK